MLSSRCRAGVPASFSRTEATSTGAGGAGFGCGVGPSRIKRPLPGDSLVRGRSGTTRLALRCFLLDACLALDRDHALAAASRALGPLEFAAAHAPRKYVLAMTSGVWPTPDGAFQHPDFAADRKSRHGKMNGKGPAARVVRRTLAVSSRCDADLETSNDR